ncbi:MAG TPA: hypothetical protein VMI31_02825 [Fimbriimonadaceae bacterium]|nr:hypothetical protein [Fimbriimonadaceae bacterium]
MSAHARQYTVRGVPAEVDRILRERAKRRKVSINQVILEELTTATVGARQVADFSDLVGRWVEDPGFDAAVAQNRRVDPEDWQ